MLNYAFKPFHKQLGLLQLILCWLENTIAFCTQCVPTFVFLVVDSNRFPLSFRLSWLSVEVPFSR